MGVQIELLEDHSYLGPKPGNIGSGIIQGHPIDDNVTLLDGFESVNAADECTFAGTAGATDYNDFSLANGQVNLFQDMEGSKPFVDPSKFNHNGSPFRSSSSNTGGNLRGKARGGYWDLVLTLDP